MHFKKIPFSVDDIVDIAIKVVLWTLSLFALLYVIGSYVEQKSFPVRVNQKVENIFYDRSKGYLCWDWYSIKVRQKPAVNMAVKLKDADDKEVLLSTFNRYTFIPWQLSNPVPLGNINQPLCTFIPPGYTPKEPFVVNQYVYYPGLLNLWNLTTSLPTIRFDHQTPEVSSEDKFNIELDKSNKTAN